MYIKQFLAIAAIAALSACNSGDKTTTEPNSTETTVTESATPDADANTTTATHEEGEAAETHKLNVMGAGPHQGIIVEASQGHMEMSLNGKDAMFYPLDDRTEPIDSKGWTGKAVVQYPDGDSKNATLANKNGALVAEGVNTGENFKAVVTLMNNGQNVSATFENGTANADGHTDPEHHSDEHGHHSDEHQH